MTSIPKDGKSYLAWMHHYGMHLVRWSQFDDCYISGGDMGKYFWAGGVFTRWMDEKGQWHEVSDG